ncbi:phosphoglycerate dehydrogenase [Sphingobacterium sp. ML3W]|uniref:2-hydroxyacid dehydrogenase n=1 Tax=Sphingobacterium sp. ML3W TaxID=1538644 RepID=UPI0004F80508|nr:NAD(P)-dependent oxidoreductase [Sphingobacterium sp. ML3W]AIM37263.1 phosphoglycerate dehydrogenase [Sphingobacterium sp. ML3W]
MKKNVLLLETIAEEAYHLLDGQVNLFTGYDDASLNKVLEKHTIHAIITRGKGQINKALLEACPDLLVAARCGVGLDNVDIQEATIRNIKVIHAPASNAATIAEHTLALMLMLMRNLYQSIAEVKNNNWNWRNQYTGDELHGKTLGIVGLGNIGQRVAKLGDAFGMQVLYSSRTSKDVPYPQVSLDSLLQQADVVSLHVPYTSETGVLIGAPQLALMKSNTLLINTARGALIDHNALILALDTGIIAGFAADVLPEEPPQQDAPIVKHPRVLITPHSGSLTATTYQQMCVSTVKNVLAVLEGKGPDKKSIYNFNALQAQS